MKKRMIRSKNAITAYSAMDPALLDQYHRHINYLRLSVTDRCNLRCIYCMPEKGVSIIPHHEILTYEEILRVVGLCIRVGIRKVRVTGGEPLVRKGIIPFLKRLCRMDGLEEVTLTTNGVLLKNLARPIRESGIRRINVSMDTLRQERFRQITREDYFDQVWEGIEEAESVGLSPIKINVVLIRGINHDEILDLVRLTYKKPYHIRFIELMPVCENNWTKHTFISIKEILEEIRTLGSVRPIISGPLDGPADRYALEGAIGEIGLIGALSNDFCVKCNRLRMTADGHLRGCLFSDQGIDIKTPLREGRGDSHLLEKITYTIRNKPQNHGINGHTPGKSIRSMNCMGG